MTKARRARTWIILSFCFAYSAICQDDTIEISTNLVEVPVSVLDRNGKYVSDLKREQFTIFENGVEQQMQLWQPVNNPVSILFLIDASGSMESHSNSVLNALARFVGQLREIDQVAVAVFDSDSKLHFKSEFAAKPRFTLPSSLNSSSNNIMRGEQRFTTTFDAVEASINFMSGIKGRKAIVYFGDGELYGHKASIKSNLADALESEAAIYTLQFGDFPAACLIPDTHWSGRTSSITGERSDIVSSDDLKNLGSDCRVYRRDKQRLIKTVAGYLSGLSERSGGRAFKISDIGNIDHTFSEIVAELGQQYLLAYYPSAEVKSERRKISVKVNVPGAAVRSRKEVVFKR